LPHLAVKIHEGKYAMLKTIRPDAPVGLESVIARAMSIDREHRYPTARALKQALEEIDLGGKFTAGATLLAPATAIDGTPKLVIDQSKPEPSSQADAVSGMSIHTTGERKGRGRLFAILAAAVATICGVAAVWNARREARRATIEAPVVLQTAVPSASAETAAPEVLPTLSPVEPLAPATAAPEEPVRHGAARPSRAPAQRLPSRATRHGLVQRNPF
jgi:serine/threonine-protein kinase